MQNKGYVLLSRRIFDSAIWRDSADVLKLFVYLFGNARHVKKPKKYPGFEVKRGELLTSLNDLAEENEYMERGKVKRWSRAKVARMLKVLEKQEYITLLADTYGTHISICNYEQYQNPKYYKADSGETPANSSETLGANVRTSSENNSNKEKNDKKGKKETGELFEILIKDLIPIDRVVLSDAWHGFIEMRKKIKKPMTDYAEYLKAKKLVDFKEAGENVTDILNESTSNNWTDLYSIKNKQDKRRELTTEEKAAQLP